MNFLKWITVIFSLVPIEFIGLNIDYQTGLLVGYIPFIIVACLIGFYFIKAGFKINISIVICRIIGIFISWKCVHLFMDVYNSSGYFKPFSTDSFVIVLGVIHVIVILMMSLIIYGFSIRNN